MRPLVLFAALAACNPPPTLPPGTATVQFTPALNMVDNLTLTSAHVHLHAIRVLGDALPNPLVPPPPTDIDLDLLSTGASVTFTRLPQGVYSRVQLSFDNVMIAGAWRGTPVSAHLAMFGAPRVDLRSADGRELGPAQDIVFEVPVDVASWFADDILDDATPTNDAIVVDDQNNPDVTGELTMRVGLSFGL